MPIFTAFIERRYIRSWLPVRRLQRINQGRTKRMARPKQTATVKVLIMARSTGYIWARETPSIGRAAQKSFADSSLPLGRMGHFANRILAILPRAHEKGDFEFLAVAADPQSKWIARGTSAEQIGEILRGRSTVRR